MKDIKNIIESILYVAGEPININLIAKVMNLNYDETRNLLEELKIEKYNENSGIVLNIYKDEVLFTTNESNYDYISDFFNFDKQKQLTNAALEVLSIIAYKQPVTKAEIDNIRGVKSDHIISKLLNDDFIYVFDKLDQPGLPNLYKTTNKFLLKFNLENIEQLPEIDIEGIEI